MCAGVPALANPALWIVHSPTATVYLFGTIHVLPKSAKWRFPALDDALAASDTLYVEVAKDSIATKESLARTYGLEPWHGTTRPFSMTPSTEFLYISVPPYLSTKLDSTDKTRLDEAALKAGLPGGTTALENMKPWMAAMTLTKGVAIRAGYEPQFDVGKALQGEFASDGKPVRGFETAQEQVKSLADLPYAAQLHMLHNVLAGKGEISIETLVHIWESGDEADMANAVNGQIRKYYPDIYQVMLVDRNRNWAQQIADLLQQHGTVFVAVGAGHLVGPDSVQAQLRKLGIETERVH